MNAAWITFLITIFGHVSVALNSDYITLCYKIHYILFWDCKNTFSLQRRFRDTKISVVVFANLQISSVLNIGCECDKHYWRLVVKFWIGWHCSRIQIRGVVQRSHDLNMLVLLFLLAKVDGNYTFVNTTLYTDQFLSYVLYSRFNWNWFWSQLHFQSLSYWQISNYF